MQGGSLLPCVIVLVICDRLTWLMIEPRCRRALVEGLDPAR
jgi:hypothetical protein